MKSNVMADLAAWSNVVAVSVLLGATVYQMQVIVPEMSRDLPRSAQALAANPIFPANFWMSVSTRLAEGIPFLALALNWKTPRRRWLLAGSVMMVLMGLLMPLFFLPRLEDMGLLMPRIPATDPERLTKATREWIIGDQIRFWLLLAPSMLVAMKALVTPAERA